MTATLIDGKAIAAGLRAEVAARVKSFHAKAGRLPGLTVVLVGDDPASEVYVRNKGIQTREAGMISDEIRLPGSISQAELLAVVRKLNEDDAVDGILVQMPLPKQIDANAVIAAIDPAKDVDGLHPVNAGKLAQGMKALTPCTPLGCMILLEKSGVKVAGSNALVIGRSILVGRPVAALLLAANATVTIAHSQSRDLAALCRQADIVVAAVGRPELVRGEWIRPGACVLDVGINRMPGEGGKSKLIGDVHFASAREVAGQITPVPGGVGPMTIACLLQNTLTAACWRSGIDPETV
ncbi:MAG TPA: bifunctional methylenetetrahydrofolate dehydrogenase/methenyltetrahydrofolate cyclohydrolase FolD [Ferrovibrio sp.]|uniref:bifunctional methylenetetrahydrofolate dehydrogenase/methenyltetrahydrofolate cyclohydrolase FolD n=1 Tax=Ferrovibrio sp. TaxID=1917215 RepID=UPI002B4B7CBC|nr:bifunctional methylenetetrahydrofolate dehydrogenase/methenyltetrahydrofolate cyclohydrolase FolD [Ferrovibrio sp.]HLT76294.1 bifunctional methylenetetrahydrofolate dehydrogenase/methenyltetrahydrofolate cyclohydrolase FolD [Ferrovibrio sp.]